MKFTGPPLAQVSGLGLAQTKSACGSLTTISMDCCKVKQKLVLFLRRRTLKVYVVVVAGEKSNEGIGSVALLIIVSILLFAELLRKMVSILFELELEHKLPKEKFSSV